MQFYLDGYRPGDPTVAEAHPSVAARPDGLPADCDVLIVGCGPAGLVLAAQLAAFPEIRTVLVDRRDGPLTVGQADGVACRTVEMFQAFGLANRLIDEAYQVNEVCFWQPDPADPSRITRVGRVDDVEEGISEMPHVIVNQARMLAYLLDYLERSAARLRPFYGMRVTGVRRDGDGVVVDVGDTTIRAKYVVGCDGARSAVRAAMGRELTGDAMNVAWGVMDVLAVTDFPDIRLKAAVQSAEHGSVLIIPREGGFLVRLYIELDGTAGVTPESLAAAANRILHPYTIDVRGVGWWSVYEIGQRLCDRFDDGEAGSPRMFIAGDACHTHSAKAGQGMNVSMADAWNLGWKLAAVLRGEARPELLHTYSAERQRVAAELIDFDRKFAGMFSARPADSGEEFRRYFVTQGRFTAGVATRYAPSMITADTAYQSLAEGFPVGMRFHSAPVVRLADAKPVHLGHAARADGVWRLYLFGDRGDTLQRVAASVASKDIDILAVFQQGHRELAVDEMPAALLPRKGRLGLIDYEKMFCPDPRGGDIFDLRGIDRDAGCMVVVRPDQYVAHVLPLTDVDELGVFLAGIRVDTTVQMETRPSTGRHDY
ncbi:FAD-dependent monooxygenase [Actinoplanes sp. NPDC026619]|uniref:FAD-dependent monooxygenase n=1 Tax=Actinoplanes sp. NPDC026619 TaxID=3155798 RepID=UPI0033E46664